MIFGRDTISAYTRTNVTIWMILAFQGGLLNMGGLLACHSFVSHVTGFATLFAVEADQGNLFTAAGLLIVPIFFMLGASLSGALIDLQIQLKRTPRYYAVFGVMFLLLLMVVVGGFNGYFGKFGLPIKNFEDYVLISLLCLVCGTQNALITLVSKSVVRTTHLTGITTDLGIGIVRSLNAVRLHGKVEHEGRANYMRIGIIVCFCFGSVIGMELFAKLQFRGFLLPTAITGVLFFTSLYFQAIRKRLH